MTIKEKSKEKKRQNGIHIRKSRQIDTPTDRQTDMRTNGVEIKKGNKEADRRGRRREGRLE